MKKQRLSRRLLAVLNFFRSFGLDPLRCLEAMRALPYYFSNRRSYRAQQTPGGAFPLSREWHFATADRFRPAGDTFGHYFWQDLWAADWLYRRGVRTQVDVASRMDGFVAHLLPFCEVTYVDLRPLPLEWPTLSFKQGSILALPFADASVPSLSCLHVLEHIGLGRYGDPVNPGADRAAATELARVLAPGGWLLFGTPVGRERLCFDAHRVYDPATIERMFAPLRLVEFNLVPDQADHLVRSASFEEARKCEYGCGLFVFTRPGAGE